jgi:hypothetical protein
MGAISPVDNAAGTGYSALSASSGSSRTARSAGTTPAAMPITTDRRNGNSSSRSFLWGGVIGRKAITPPSNLEFVGYAEPVLSPVERPVPSGAEGPVLSLSKG